MPKNNARRTVTAKKIIIAEMPTAIAPSHLVSKRRLIASNQTMIESAKASKRYGINKKKRVDKTVPKREIKKASGKRVRFFPTTTNPAR